jgi:hypothetical protein
LYIAVLKSKLTMYYQCVHLKKNHWALWAWLMIHTLAGSCN